MICEKEKRVKKERKKKKEKEIMRDKFIKKCSKEEKYRGNRHRDTKEAIYGIGFYTSI